MMTGRVHCLLLAAAAVAAAPLHAQDAPADVPKTAERVDLDRYAGKWYEIARFPNRFQKQCAGNTTAEYAKRPDGEIDVINRCRTEDGKTDVAEGRARVVDAATNAKLEVRFAPAALAWLPMVWSPYWIIDLAPDYSVAAVGDPKREYLWILSRTPKLPEATYEELVNRLTAQGFDTARLLMTKQD